MIESGDIYVHTESGELVKINRVERRGRGFTITYRWVDANWGNSIPRKRFLANFKSLDGKRE